MAARIKNINERKQKPNIRISNRLFERMNEYKHWPEAIVTLSGRAMWAIQQYISRRRG